MVAALVFFGLLAPLSPSRAQASPPASAAEAVRFDLLKYRDRVERDGSQVRTLEVRVHLGTAQGVAEFGQLGLSYVDGYGDVAFEDVVIEKADGRRVEVKNGLIEDLNPFGVSGTSMPADLRFKKLTLPGLEPGDGLSYRIVNRQKPLAPGRAFGEIKLPPAAGGAPQTYELDLPRASGIRVRLRDGVGTTWEEVPAAADRLVRRLQLKVALPPSDRRPPTKDDLQRWIEPDVIFTSFGSWAEVSGWWWDLSKDRLKPDLAVAKEASGLADDIRTTKEKVVAFHAFLATRIRYLNVSFGLGRMQPRPAADVLRNRYGDCKDKHALLAALAASRGIDVRPVLINSTRAELRDDVPSPQQFDHMISVIRIGPAPSDWLWLDSTNPFGGPGHLLPQLRDKRALLIEANGDALLVRTPKEPPFVPRHEAVLKATLTPEGTLRGRTAWLLRSDAEFQFRALFSALPQERRAAAVKELLAGDWKEGTVDNVVVSDPLDVASPFRIEFDAEKEVPAKGSERSLWVPFPDFGLPEPADPVPEGEPAVSFGVREFSVRAEIDIPEGIRAQAPLSFSLERPSGTFRSSYVAEERTLKLARTLVLSGPSLAESDVAGYESLRSAIATDRKQEFSIPEPTPGAVMSPGSASELRTEGLAAFGRKDYAKAVDLLQKATAMDPKVKDGFEDLGRALHELGRNEDALAVLTRQIEVTPFHESAYAWRAYVLGRLNRWADAEKDMLKQIEVAPFKAWSYEELGDRRLFQERYGEAADFYTRAAAIEPKVARRWVDLGGAEAKAGRREEARKALDHAVTLDPPDYTKIQAARTYQSLGDLGKAGELAQAALPALSGRLVRMAPGDLDKGDLYWMERLVQAWRFIGEAARAAGDLARAEKYLQAAWRLAFSPEAGWALGELREGQGRLAEAVEFWSMAAAVPTAAEVLPEDRERRIVEACAKLPAAVSPPTRVPVGTPPAVQAVLARPPRQTEAQLRLMELRIVRLNGPAIVNITEEVLLLVDTEGRVERVLNLSRKKPEELDRQLEKLGAIRLPAVKPDEVAFKTIRRGLLACATASGCAIVLDLPGLGGIAGNDQASIRITKLDPKEGSTLRRGQRVEVTATVHYEIEENGMVGLGIQDEAGNPLSSVVGEEVAAGSGAITLAATFTVPEKATRIDIALPLGGLKRRAPTTFVKVSYEVR